MNKISLLLVVCILPLFCSASDEVNIEYIISSMYSGNIGRNNITMNIVSSRTLYLVVIYIINIKVIYC